MGPSERISMFFLSTRKCGLILTLQLCKDYLTGPSGPKVLRVAHSSPPSSRSRCGLATLPRAQRGCRRVAVTFTLAAAIF